MPDSSYPSITKDELVERLDSFLSNAEASGFSGVMLASLEGEVALHKPYGLADRERSMPITTDTLFDTGSVCKMFTAAAILKLQDEGRLSLNDSITRYFMDVPEDKVGITIHHLLTHTSGMHLYSGEDYELISRDDMVRRVMEMDLQWPPGTMYRYSNPAYGLLGAIVENITGEPYESYVHQHFFQPAGMLDTGYVIPEWDRERVAHGYQGDEDGGSPLDMEWLPDGPGWNLRANGGMLSTASDLYRWHLAMQGDLLLSEGARHEMFIPRVEAPSTPPRHNTSGYGLYLPATAWGTRRVVRSGTSEFGNSQYWYYPDQDLVLVLTTNTQHSTDWLVNDTLLNVLFENRSS